MQNRERKTELIVALDVDTQQEALACVEGIGECPCVKVGAQLFTRCGPAIVQALRDRGKQVFLDLKFHDIPTTVAKAARAATDLGVSFMTVHASGGRRMIEAARQAVEDSGARILAVTVLTSLSDAMLSNEVGLRESAAEAVCRYARLAVESGAHGLVCSPEEIAPLRAAVGAEPLVVTPGVRPSWAAKDDQTRVMTPREAAAAGANYVVVGRPIFRHENPAEAVRLIRDELLGQAP